MKNFAILSDALDFIESNLCGKYHCGGCHCDGIISQDDVAEACFCSLSHLQKMFRYTFHLSVGEYISKRRLTLASHDLINSDMTITDIAMKYGYNSPEVFTRAFSKLWKVTPSKFKRTWQFTNLFPPLTTNKNYYEGEEYMNRRKFDISELYDYLKNHAGCYILSFDTIHLMETNAKYGHEAGDAVILECLRRIDTAAEDDMILFRIGGDEFVLLTGSKDFEKAKNISDKITSQNETPINVNGTQIPVSMRAGSLQTPEKPMRYSELFKELTEASRK